MDSSTGDTAIDVCELKRKHSHRKGTITKIINFFDTMNNLDLDDMSEADVDNLLKSTEDAISSYKEIQTQLEELILFLDYAGEDVTDPTQAPINKTLMLNVKSMHNSFHAFHTVLRLQARLNHLEAVTSFSSPEAKITFSGNTSNLREGPRRSRLTHSCRNGCLYVSATLLSIIVPRISSEKTLHSPMSIRIPSLLSHALHLDIMILLFCIPQLLLHPRPSYPNFHFQCGKVTSWNGELSGGILCK